MDTANSANSRLKTDAEAYEDALDAIRLYGVRRPEWRNVARAIETYVSSLEATAGLHEPGV